MKAHYSEKYYRDNWDRFIKKTSENDYMNLEYNLELELKMFDKNIAEKICRIYAEKIYNTAVAILKKQLITIHEIESGKISLGYTNKIQEINETRRMIQRFEFNCLQLRDFKEKYSLS